MDIQKIQQYKTAFDLIAQNGDPMKEEQQRVFVESYYN